MDNPFLMVQVRPCKHCECACMLCTADDIGMLQIVIREMVIAYARTEYPDASLTSVIAMVDELEPRESWVMRMEEMANI